MNRCLDTIRVKQETQIANSYSIPNVPDIPNTPDSYTIPKNKTLFSRKIILTSLVVVTMFVVAISFYFGEIKSEKAYVKGTTTEDKELVEMRAKVEATKKAEIAEENKRYDDAVKSIENQRAQLLAQEAKAKADKEAQAAREKQAKAESNKIATSIKDCFDSIYAEAEKKYGVSRYLLKAVHILETRQSGDTDRASNAGAQGPMQFMPNTFQKYAQDGNGDGQALITSVNDSIYTSAKHLSANGATTGKVENALFQYNHSDAYVKKVLSLAQLLGYNK